MKSVAPFIKEDFIEMKIIFKKNIKKQMRNKTSSICNTG